MTLFDALFAPFVEFAFMRRALAGAVVLSLSACPIGVFFTLRRMSLAGDAIAHGILPGVAAGFLLFGLDVLPMTLGGVVAGLIVALLSGLVSRITLQREDSSLASLYLVSLALGVLLISLRGTSVDLMGVLFGTVLALNDPALVLIGVSATITLLGLAVIWRGLIAECLDPQFLGAVGGRGSLIHLGFLSLAVINLVAGFQALGTLLAVGLMLLPAAAARFWVRRLESLVVLAVAIGMAASYIGLLVSYHFSVPSGPAIVLTAGLAYFVSLISGRRGVIFSRVTPHRHRTG